jgi:hypothetical protein
MAWIFSLSAECGSVQESAEKFAKHFDQISWVLSSKLQSECRTRVFQDSEENWWCMVTPSGISQRGVTNPEDAQQMTELGLLLYQRLQSAPTFRYALVGVEVDEFRTYSELMTENGTPDVPFSGLVLAEEIWNHIGCPDQFSFFKSGYLWIPYEGEAYLPLQASPDLAAKLQELMNHTPQAP